MKILNVTIVLVATANNQDELMELLRTGITLMTASFGLASAWFSYQTARLIHRKTVRQRQRKWKWLRFW